MKVEKRDGTIQAFKFEKIEAAVTKVFENKPICETVPQAFIEQLRELGLLSEVTFTLQYLHKYHFIF